MNIPHNTSFDMTSGRPSVFYADGDGSWLYRFNIEPKMDIPEGQSEEKQIGWSAMEIRIWNKPTYETLVSAIIRMKYTVDAELAIQRQRELKPDNFAEYDDFCEEVKAMVKNDLM
jgi:hypothetical protein